MDVKYYSQSDEEKYIVEYFGGQVGRFLDIGAFDGKCFSNTYRLTELGWSGVCVEPAGAAFHALSKLHKDNEKVDCVCAAIGTQDGFLKFYQSPDAVSTSDEAHRSKWALSKAPFWKSFVCSVTFETLLRRFPPPYDFLNIDTEGTNWRLIESAPIKRFGAKLICVEFDDKYYDMLQLFRSHGYDEIHRTAENLIVGKV